jgi:hypothetical protein
MTQWAVAPKYKYKPRMRRNREMAGYKIENKKEDCKPSVDRIKIYKLFF